MEEVIVSKSINVSASEAWKKLSSFRGIEEFSPIERSETIGHGAGATRTCYMPDGAAIYEVLEEVEDGRMEMQYKITKGPFPIKGYVSNVKVEKTGEGSCKIIWGCEFETEPENKNEMVNLFEGFYHTIIDSLENLINRQN
ncbi:MAG TPA: SRPBCC family protein [Cyclobacteriaceae bacterium]